MKPYLVDVPVKINIWIRPDCQRQQFEVIKKARPSILFIQSDGGRNNNEWKLINQNRELYEYGIDWQCKVFHIYENYNNGLYTMAQKTSSLIWNTVDRCIFFEDDQIPAVSYFRFCAELLEKYKDDERVECICGRNQLGISENVSSDYFFSRQGSIWGAATWKRVIQNRTFEYGKDPYIMNLLKNSTKHDPIIWRRLKTYAYDKLCDGHIAGGEFWFEFDMHAQSRVQIIPKKNMISNIGFTSNSAHATTWDNLSSKTKKLFNTKIYEINFPLKHPIYVIPDLDFEKKRNKLLNRNQSKIQKIINNIFRFIHYLKKGDFVTIKNKIHKIFKSKYEK